MTHPTTRRCVYCAPRWTWGTRPWSRLGRFYALLWPPHIIGEDYGPPYTDTICPTASAKIDAWMRADIRAAAASGRRPPDFGPEPREFEVADVMIALFAAIIIIQCAWIDRQARRIENYQAVLQALPLDERTQDGNKAHRF